VAVDIAGEGVTEVAMASEDGEQSDPSLKSPLVSEELDLGGDMGSSGGADVTLALSDLMQDANGEVVLFNDGNFKTLAIAADAHAVDQGLADPHVTAAGEDVSGYCYITFENGMTLYYQPALEVIVRHDAG
jgi:hypothetical protein